MNYWLNDLSAKSAATRAKYQGFFEKFCAYAKITPNELIDIRKKDLKADDPREARGCENLLKGFINQMRDQEYSPATMQIAYAAVKSFFESNEYPLRMKRVDYPVGESLGSRVITKQQIKQILDDPKRIKHKKKTRALIMFLKDTGLGVSDVGNFTYGAIREPLEKNLEFIPLELLRQKTRTVVKTFIGPEAIIALKEYIGERKAGTQRIPPETLTDKSPLFRVSRSDNSKRISRGGLSSMVRFQCLRVGVKLSAHSFRKYVQTNLEAAGVNPNWIDRVLGHKLSGSRDPYSQPSDEQLLEAYKSAYTALRVYPDKNEVETRVSKLESDLVERNDAIAELLTRGNQKTTELKELKSQYLELRNMVEKLIESKSKK
jgi:integrase